MSGKKNSAAVRMISSVAAGQHGVISRQQLGELGLSQSVIGRLVDAGHLHRIFRGVYAVGHPAIGERQTMFAATLACGEDAVVSHRSAAALLGLLDRAPAVIDLIAPGQRGRKIDGIRHHQAVPPAAEECGTVERIPCTSPARTLVDCAGTVGNRSLRSMFERAAARKMLDIRAIEAALGTGGRRGVVNLRVLIDEWRPAAPIAKRSRLKSPLEAKVLPILAQRGIAVPRANAPVNLIGGRVIEVDFLWAEQRFVLEADSRDFHGTEVAFERDRRRDRELLRAGYSTLRVTSLQAETEAAEIADAICSQLREPRPPHPSGGELSPDR